MKKTVENKNKIKKAIITALSMFYDLEDPNQFLQDAKKILHKDGILLIEQADLYSILKNNVFDTICHEHLEYYTYNSLRYLFAGPYQYNGNSARSSLYGADFSPLQPNEKSNSPD